MKRLCLMVALLLPCTTAALANPVPDPGHCTVIPADPMQGVVLCPAAPIPLNESVNTVTIRDSYDRPYSHAWVEIRLGSDLVTCPGALLTGVTGTDGVTVITLSGGGCRMGSGACEVRANGILIRQYQNAKSPDYDGVSGDLRVSASDYVPFGRAFNLGEDPGRCYDYDNSGPCGPGDFGIFARAFNQASLCP